MNINNLNLSSQINNTSSYSDESLLHPEATQSLNRDSSSSSTLNRSSSSDHQPVELEKKPQTRIVAVRNPVLQFNQSLHALSKLCESKPESDEAIRKAKKNLKNAFEHFIEKERPNYNPPLFLQTMRKVQDTYNNYRAQLVSHDPRKFKGHTDFSYLLNKYMGKPLVIEFSSSLKSTTPESHGTSNEREISHDLGKEGTQSRQERIAKFRFDQSLKILSDLCELKSESTEDVYEARKYLKKAFERFIEKERPNYNPPLFLQTMRKVQDTYNKYRTQLLSDHTRNFKKLTKFSYLLNKYKDKPLIIEFSSSLKSTNSESPAISDELEIPRELEDEEILAAENLLFLREEIDGSPQLIKEKKEFTNKLESLLQSVEKLSKKKIINFTDQEIRRELIELKKRLGKRLANFLKTFSSNLNPPLFKSVTDRLGNVYDQLGEMQEKFGGNPQTFKALLFTYSKYPLAKEISYSGFSQTENEQASSQSAEHHPKKHKKIKRTTPKEDITGSSLGLIQPEDEEMTPAVFLEAKAVSLPSKPNKKRKQPAEALELKSSIASSSIPQNQAKLLLKKTPIPGKNLEDKIRSLGKTYQAVPRYSKEFRTFWKEAEGDTLNPQYKKMYEKHRELLEQGENPIDQHLDLVDSENEIFESVLIAKKRIPKGTFLGEYSGQFVLSDRRTDPNQRYLFDVVQGTNSEGEAVEFVIDGDATCNHGSFFSHKTMSNVTIELYDDEDGRHVLFFANEDVKKGDLLTIDYGPKYWEALGIDPIEEYDIQKS